MGNRWLEIIEDDNHRLSSNRVSVLFGIFVGSIIIFTLMVMAFRVSVLTPHITIEYLATANTAALTQILSTLVTVTGAFFLLCAGVYGMAKFSDNSVAKTQIAAEAPPAEPAKVVVPDAKTVNVKADGNVSINEKEKEPEE